MKIFLRALFCSVVTQTKANKILSPGKCLVMAVFRTVFVFFNAQARPSRDVAKNCSIAGSVFCSVANVHCNEVRDFQFISSETGIRFTLSTLLS
jgi:hypothetical protein